MKFTLFAIAFLFASVAPSSASLIAQRKAALALALAQKRVRVVNGNLIIKDADCTLRLGLTSEVAAYGMANMEDPNGALVSDKNPMLSQIIEESKLTACVNPHEESHDVARHASVELKKIGFVAGEPIVTDAGNMMVTITCTGHVSSGAHGPIASYTTLKINGDNSPVSYVPKGWHLPLTRAGRVAEKFCNVVAHKKALALAYIAEQMREVSGFDSANYVMKNFVPQN